MNSVLIFSHLLFAFILFGGGFAWVLAVGQLTLEYRNKNNYLLFAHFFFLGIWLILGGCVFLGLEEALPFNIFTVSIPSFYFSIPLLYFYFQCILNPRFKFQSHHLIHFIFPILSVVFLLPGAQDRLSLYSAMNFLKNQQNSAHETIYAVVMYSSMILFSVYLWLIARDVKVVSDKSAQSKKNYFVLILRGVYILLAVDILWFLDRIFSWAFSPVLYAIVSFLLIAIYLLSNRYPEFLLELKLEAEQAGYAHSQTRNLDAKEILQTIEKTMAVEKLFTDSHLTLKSLALRLGITTHQLSEIINRDFGKNFNAMINQYRISEAKQILINDPERKILAIAFDVGFNSPSAFYNAFQKIVGISPSQYRKENPA